MSLTDFLTIVAIVVGPIAAVQIQKRLEQRREDRARKLWIFKTLMATRASTVSVEHVQALNGIDLEFQGDDYQEVRTAWRTYLDHLNSFPKDDEKRQPVWSEKSVELLARVLIAMGQSLGYEFDEVHIKKGIYFPQAHGDMDLEIRAIRRGLAQVLFGDRALKMEVIRVPANETEANEQKAIRDALLALLDGKRELPVRTSGERPPEKG